MLSEKIRNLIIKLQNLSNLKKKTIFFTIIIISGLLLGSWWIYSTIQKINHLDKKLKFVSLPQIDLPKIDFPKIEIPDQLKNLGVTKEQPKVQDEVVDWKTYNNNEAKFSLQHPAEWGLTTDSDNDEKILIFEGKEGSIRVDYGKASDPNGYKNFTKSCKNEEIVCEKTQVDNLSFTTYHAVSHILENIANSKSDIEAWSMRPDTDSLIVSILIQAYPPYISNRDIVLKIFSTFKFINNTK